MLIEKELKISNSIIEIIASNQRKHFRRRILLMLALIAK